MVSSPPGSVLAARFSKLHPGHGSTVLTGDPPKLGRFDMDNYPTLVRCPTRIRCFESFRSRSSPVAHSLRCS
jgi:hypothetical protein